MIVITSAIHMTTITPSEAAITVVVLPLADEVIITHAGLNFAITVT